MRRQTQGPSGDRGASLVEFALIAPVLFALLLGMITGGLALSAKNSMTNAVREGGRLAATLPPGDDWDTAWALAVRDRVVSLSSGDLADEEICVEIIDAAASASDPPVGKYYGSSCSLDSRPGTPDSATKGCLVKVWAETTAELNALFFTRELAMQSDAVGIYERAADCP